MQNFFLFFFPSKNCEKFQKLVRYVKHLLQDAWSNTKYNWGFWARTLCKTVRDIENEYARSTVYQALKELCEC